MRSVELTRKPSRPLLLKLGKTLETTTTPCRLRTNNNHNTQLLVNNE